MGNFSFTAIAADTTSTTITWSGLSDQQKLYIAKTYAYEAQIPDPDNEGEMIDNAPLMAVVLTQIFQELSARVKAKYIAENMADIQEAADVVADIVPTSE